MPQMELGDYRGYCQELLQVSRGAPQGSPGGVVSDLILLPSYE